MGDITKIEWCDHTFNPWIGCTRISPGCDHCYAESLARRYGWATWGPGEARKRTSEANWAKPLKWDRDAKKVGRRHLVFCASLADVFDAEVPDAWREELFDRLIRKTTCLDWLLLTKRPQVAAKWFAAHPAPANVWLGTTVENQKMADLRIPMLLSIDVKVRFLSCEPLLGPIDLRHVAEDGDGYFNALSSSTGPNLDWVISGGESGPHARPSYPDWFRALRDQCAAAEVPFFFKQWGEWIDEREASAQGNAPGAGMFDGKGKPKGDGWHFYNSEDLIGGAAIRIGKKAAGALLDGREHREFPA